MQASVVLCVSGRNRLLSWLIRGAVVQTVSADDYEIIVVEGEGAGHPRDFFAESDVWRVVNEQSLISPVMIRYLYVPDTRSSVLLQAARRAARSACLISLPTDQVVDKEWLADGLRGSPAATLERLAE